MKHSAHGETCSTSKAFSDTIPSWKRDDAMGKRRAERAIRSLERRPELIMVVMFDSKPM
jgi:hypothetical protein